MEKKISVIVPCYNMAEYVGECIEHLIHQTIGIENIEIILVDDASTDNGATLSELMKYEKEYPENILVIPLEENLHQGGARNVGLLYSSGEYIAFCDADDWFAENALEELYHVAKENDCDVVEFEHYKVELRSGEDRKPGRDLEENQMWCIDSPEKRRQYIMTDGSKSTLGCWDKIYRRSMIIDNNIRFAEHVFYEEAAFTQLVRFYAEKHYFLHLPLYFYYIHDNSTMRSSYENKKLDQLQTYEVLMAELQKRGFDKMYPQETEFIFWKGYFFFGAMFAAAKVTFFTRGQFMIMQKRAAEIAPDISKNPYYIQAFEKLPNVANLTYCDITETDMADLYQIFRDIVCYKYGIRDKV